VGREGCKSGCGQDNRRLLKAGRWLGHNGCRRRAVLAAWGKWHTPGFQRGLAVAYGPGGRGATRRSVAHATARLGHRAGALAYRRRAQEHLVHGRLMAGQRPASPPLLSDLASAWLIADCGQEADPLVVTMATRGTLAVMPPRRKRCQPHTYGPATPSTSWSSACSSHLKQFRRVATHYAKLAAHFLAFIHLVTTVLWLRDHQRAT